MCETIALVLKNWSTLHTLKDEYGRFCATSPDNKFTSVRYTPDHAITAFATLPEICFKSAIEFSTSVLAAFFDAHVFAS